jgi:hypothetical protein
MRNVVTACGFFSGVEMQPREKTKAAISARKISRFIPDPSSIMIKG